MTTMANPLPWDYFRCHPETADTHCKNCRRWAEQSGQETGPRTTHIQVTNSRSEACSYMPISFLKENQ
jgi:hypothetical protein